MKYSTLTQKNQDLIKELDALDSDGRKKRSRKYDVKGTWKPKQHNTDPKTVAPRVGSVTVWEFEVNAFTSNAGAYRLIRRQQAAAATWYWATHIGESSFKYEEITDYTPAEKPTAEVPATPAVVPALTQHQLKASAVKTEEQVVPENWDD